jgi:hypothetical protein
VFRLQQVDTDKLEADSEYFIFYKIKSLIDQYDSYFTSSPITKKIKSVIEIGMWDGGSLAFWREILLPDKIIGIDLIENGGNKYFNKYLANHTNSVNKIKPYWGTDQTNSPKLRKIIKDNFGSEPIDIVFDDGSHMYAQTKISFNTIFPYMAIGGLYIIEDWAWSHWKGFENNCPPDTEPTKFIYELIQASANVGLIESVTIFQGFVVIKRGKEIIKENDIDFKLEKYIYNRPLNLKSKIKAARTIFQI